MTGKTRSPILSPSSRTSRSAGGWRRNCAQAVERTQFYMNRMPLAFIAWDRDFRVAEWNHAAEEIFGWSAAEAIGQHAYELIVPPEVQPQVDRSLGGRHQHRQHGQPFHQ